MVVGFNHNVRHQGELYHVQTEDGGLKNPHILTLLYRGGTIVTSRKTSYADITKAEQLEKIVEDLMKEQHKEMLRRLKEGAFDELIAQRFAPSAPPAPSVAAAPVAAPAPPLPPQRDASPAPRQSVKKEPSLDDLILSYLTGEDP
ncbi:hypothetical protein [Geoalkalibacter sp.]|jgi:hypothetical protein|uniref:hypothetical protein n=1 Tax=Geoalkalibacter sp. TaxID=3041440 RepID=UPI00272E5C02|nr:hypothetical protein [Geoalkalibacter sp.]